MNDCHNNDAMDHPFPGSFWKMNPQFFLQGRTDYFTRCLDYAHPEVRDFYKALVGETLERYDIDGLELDFIVLCEFVAPEGAAAIEPSIRVNGRKTERLRDDAGKGGVRTMAFAVPAAALTPTTAQVIRISCPEATPITVQRVEMSYNPQP